MLLDGAHVGVTVRTLTSNSRRNQSPIAYRRFHKSTSENRLAPIDGQSNLRFTRKPILPFTRSAHSVSFASSEALLETTLLRQKEHHCLHSATSSGMHYTFPNGNRVFNAYLSIIINSTRPVFLLTSWTHSYLRVLGSLALTNSACLARSSMTFGC